MQRRTKLLILLAGGTLWALGYLWNLSKAEWASWVQAVGSIAAIGVAIWLGRRSEVEAKSGAMTHYTLFKMAAQDSMNEVLSSARAHALHKVLFARARVHDAVKLGETIPLHMVAKDDAKIATEVRSLLTQASEFLDDTIKTSGNAISFQHIAGEFDRLLGELKRVDPASESGDHSGDVTQRGN